jgi:hypothetical protein
LRLLSRTPDSVAIRSSLALLNSAANIVSPQSFVTMDGWEDLVVGSQPRLVQTSAGTTLEFRVVVKQVVSQQLFDEDFGLAMIQKLGGALRAYVCVARVIGLDLTFAEATAAGKMSFRVQDLRAIQDEVVQRAEARAA